jgi:hypothetical protein
MKTYCRNCESSECPDQTRCAASCCWCDELATVSETTTARGALTGTVASWTDQACTVHAALYFAGSLAGAL